MTEPNGAAVAVLPYGTRVTIALADMPLDGFVWPLGQPERLLGRQVRDLSPNDHLLCYVTSRLLYMPRPEVKAKVSVMIVEPQAVHGHKMAWLRLLWWRFHRVLNCNPRLLARIPNGERFVLGSTWVPEWCDVDIAKSRMVSLIASKKTYYEGHKLRHRVVDWLRSSSVEADIMGRGYKPFDRKAEGLAPYRYSVIIENAREPSYFTEKLVDCLLCATVPIYWGAPDIGDFFDTRGMIICESFGDLTAALGTLSEEDYQSRLEIIADNRDKAAKYANHELAAARIVLRSSSRIEKRAP